VVSSGALSTSSIDDGAGAGGAFAAGAGVALCAGGGVASDFVVAAAFDAAGVDAAGGADVTAAVGVDACTGVDAFGVVAVVGVTAGVGGDCAALSRVSTTGASIRATIVELHLALIAVRFRGEFVPDFMSCLLLRSGPRDRTPTRS
jgi:hypothetical protein